MYNVIYISLKLIFDIGEKTKVFFLNQNLRLPSYIKALGLVSRKILKLLIAKH